MSTQQMDVNESDIFDGISSPFLIEGGISYWMMTAKYS